MKLSALLAPLLDAKADHELIRRQILAYEAEQVDALAKRRESDAKRQANKRERDGSHVTSRDVTVTVSSHERATPGRDKPSNLEISGKEGKKEPGAPKARGDLDAFKAELSPFLDAERIEALCAVRRKKGATFSAYAGRVLVKALHCCPDINAAADEMVLRNWTGIKPDWLASRQHGPPEKGVFGAAKRIIESRTNGPEIFPRNIGNVEQLPAGTSDRSGPVVEDIRSGFGRDFVAGNR